MRYKIFSGVVLLLFLTSVVFSYYNIPDTVILYKDREWNNNNISRLNISDNSVEASGKAIVPRKVGDYQASLSIFGIPYKKVTLKVVEEKEVIPGGQTIGIRLYSDGLVVIALGRVCENEKSPAEQAGVKVGDLITKINGEKVGNPDNFTRIIKNSEKVTLEIERGGEILNMEITPAVSTSDSVKRIGLWVRDSTAGVGTLTYMSPSTLEYGALGHSISDVDTGVKFQVLRGSIEECRIGDIKKGAKGEPGELKGVFFSGAEVLGNITKNEKEGIFGTLSNIPLGEAIPLGHKSEIKKGTAYIRTSLDGINTDEYEIEIMKVSKSSKSPTKGMVIKVTDKELLEKTGGIVQGMSGSPIIQEGKLIGAVTHVLVNDPTKGYGIFIENMLEAAG